jgi:hypothetical protein
MSAQKKEGASKSIKYQEKVHETKKAILYKINNEQKWIPKSQIVNEDTDAEVVLVKEWFVEKENL